MSLQPSADPTARPHPQLPTDAQTQANTMAGRWGFASGLRGKRTWWVGRKVGGQLETHSDARGSYIGYATARAAADAADRLNALDAEASAATASFSALAA